MINPFWNPTEHRLRALWRLVLQVFILILSIELPVSILRLIFHGIPGKQYQILDTLTLPVLTLVGIFFSLWLAGLLLDRRPFDNFGFHFSHKWWMDFVFGLALGAGLMLSIFLVELAAGWVTITATFQGGTAGLPFIPAFCISLVLFLCVGLYEEMWFRGYFLRNLAEGFNLRIIGPRTALLLAYLVSSIIFGLLHAGNPNASMLSTFLLLFAGLFLGLGFILTGELAIPIGFHITWNLFEGNVFGFNVSGTTPPGTFIQINQSGPTLWTGGAFGPEAGLIGLAAIILGSLAIYLWVKANQKTAPLQTQLTQYLRQVDA